MSSWFTHRKYLEDTLNSFDYSKVVNCLEFGTGEGSALIFHKIAKNQPNLRVRAFESDKEWLEKTKKKYTLSNYEFNLVEGGKAGWDSFDYESLKNEGIIYDFIFVDQSAQTHKWHERLETIDNLKHIAKNIMVHDYHHYNMPRAEYGYKFNKLNDNTISENSFWYDRYSDEFELIGFKQQRPPTLLMKNKSLL